MPDFHSFYFSSFDGTKLYVKHWHPLKSEKKGMILIVHGLGETADYYDEFAVEAVRYGFDVVVPEARGHGQTAGIIGSPDYMLKGGNPGPDSLHTMSKDLLELVQLMQKDHHQRPVILLGHSMGSIVAQLYAQRYSEQLLGLILIGLPFIENANELLNMVNNEIISKGLKAPCKETFNAMFSGANTPFEPIKTELDWITSDEKMVNESLALPTSFVLFNNEFYYNFLLAFLETNDIENWRNVTKPISISILSGGMDVIGHYGKSVKEQYNMLRAIGIQDVSYKIYDGLRHSILRETQRKKVTKDILEWVQLRISLLR